MSRRQGLRARRWGAREGDGCDSWAPGASSLAGGEAVLLTLHLKLVRCEYASQAQSREGSTSLGEATQPGLNSEGLPGKGTSKLI